MKKNLFLFLIILTLFVFIPNKVSAAVELNKIEGIVTTSSRMGQLCKNKTTPKNRDEEEIAVQYYKKCIGLDLKNNPYLASSLSNLALLYDDIGETDLAIKYYQESLKIDEQANNFNGLYSSLIKLAEIYSAKNPEQALECFNKALEYAKILNEDFYIVSVNTAIGDFYLNRKENELAYKYLKTAYQYAQKTASKDNADKIMLRLNDIKIRIGEERFNELEK